MDVWNLFAPQRFAVVTASANDVAQKENTRWIVILTDCSALVLTVPTLWADWATTSLTFWSLVAWTFIPWKIYKVTTITWWTVALAY